MLKVSLVFFKYYFKDFLIYSIITILSIVSGAAWAANEEALISELKGLLDGGQITAMPGCYIGHEDTAENLEDLSVDTDGNVSATSSSPSGKHRATVNFNIGKMEEGRLTWECRSGLCVNIDTPRGTSRCTAVFILPANNNDGDRIDEILRELSKMHR